MNDTLMTDEDLRAAHSLLNELVRTMGRTPELIRSEKALMILEGGYMRWSGDYDGARGYLEEALKIAFREQNREEAASDALEQLCYLGVQMDDPKLLERYVYPYYRCVRKLHMHTEIGVALRLLAVLKIMEQSYASAEKLLKMSLKIFETLENHGNGYMLEMTAAIHYYGDIALHRGLHAEALSHYGMCAKLCEGKGFYRGLGLHIAKAAWCAARLGRTEETREYLDYARPLLDGFQSRRGAGLCGGEIVFGLCALFSLRDGKPAVARENLLYADKLSDVMQKPMWTAILLCIKAVLRSSRKGTFEDILPHEPEYYLSRSGKLFGELGLPGEIGAYDQLKRACGLTANASRAE
jgi:tetratricopeptide (TPR) repeat protein